MGYTKGEWRKEGYKIKAFGSGTIAICPSPTNDEGVFEFVANARLIAAAPDLYEACKGAIRWWTKERDNFFPPEFTAIVKALAKAEGK